MRRPASPRQIFIPAFTVGRIKSGGGNGQQHFRNRHEFIKGVYQFWNSAETLSPGMKNGSAARRFRMKAGGIARSQQKKGPSQRMESPANEEPAGENHSPAASVKPVHEQHAQGSGNLVLIRHAGGKRRARLSRTRKKECPESGKFLPIRSGTGTGNPARWRPTRR